MIAIIGGGASGLMASILIKRELPMENVMVLERMDRVGKKLLATGNGRCNLTNTNMNANAYYGDVRQAMEILSDFNSSDAIEFFGNLGVVCVIEPDGRVYPKSGQASSVLDVLREECAYLGVEECCGVGVASIKKSDGKFIITARSGDVLRADCVLIAGGGKAQPNLGSDGSCYSLVKAFGHTVTDVTPVLVQLKTDKEEIRSLEGIKLDCRVTLAANGEPLRSERGEVLFTAFGVSGPPVFQLSTLASMRKEVKCFLELDLIEEKTDAELCDILTQRALTLHYKPLNSFFCGMINKRVGQAVLKSANVLPLTRECSTLKPAELSQLAKKLKHWQLEVTGTMPFANAQATAGGAVLSEYSRFLQSKLCPGLFAAGELLNVNGDCGGYNLQWAWASAYAASNGIVEYIRSYKAQ